MNEQSFSVRQVGILIGALALLGLGIYFYQQNADKKEQDGKSALYKIQKTFEEEMKAVPEAERAPGVSLDVDTKFSKSVSELNGMLAAKSAPSRVLFEAGMKLGSLYLDYNQTEKAIEAMKKTQAFAKSKFQKAASLYLLGTAQERANHPKESLEYYQQGVSTDVDGLKGELMLGMVRDYLKLNDKANAKLYSEKLAKDLPGAKPTLEAEELVKQ